jgi:hypothetical protein
VLLVHGKPKPIKEDLQTIPTVKEFALRFLDGYAKANRLKPSGIASKETVSACIWPGRSATSAWMRSRPRT